jgi:hypothetical protein
MLNVTVFNQVISENKRQELAEYSNFLYQNNKMSKNPNSDGRYRKRLDSNDSHVVTDIISEMDEYFLRFNGKSDTCIGNIITYNYAGSTIQSHQDDYGVIQLRMNVIVEKDEFSGNPIIGGFHYKIKPRDSWIFSPSSIIHGTTTLKQGIRINLSLGWNFEKEEDYLNAFVSVSS